MARNRSTNRRRRRGRFSFLTKLLCILLIAGAVVAALTVFFKVQSITVSGNARYTSEEVVAASGIEIEDNLFLLNKYSAAQAIFEKLPYVEGGDDQPRSARHHRYHGAGVRGGGGRRHAGGLLAHQRKR